MRLFRKLPLLNKFIYSFDINGTRCQDFSRKMRQIFQKEPKLALVTLKNLNNITTKKLKLFSRINDETFTSIAHLSNSCTCKISLKSLFFAHDFTRIKLLKYKSFWNIIKRVMFLNWILPTSKKCNLLSSKQIRAKTLRRSSFFLLLDRWQYCHVSELNFLKSF